MDAYLPFIIEAATFAVAYIILAEWIIMPATVACFRTFAPKAWADLEKKDGTFSVNQQGEFPLMMGIGLQHTFAGSLVFAAALTGRPALAAHGMLCEVGWEVKDALCLLLGMPPYRDSSVKPAIKGVIVFHHLPGILTAIPLIKNGFHENVHVQYIAATMILAGGVGVLVGTFCNLLTGAPRLAHAIQLVEYAIFMGCRFVIFPYEAWKLTQELLTKDQTMFAALVVLGVGLMMVFNVMIASIKTKKLFASPGKTRRAQTMLRHQSSLSLIVNPKDEGVVRLLKQVSASSMISAGE